MASRARRLRVLCADDDVDLRGLVTATLERHGFELDGAGNGQEAIALFRAKRHDVIIVDLMMPAMNGYEFLRELRAVDPDAMKRTVVMTGSSRETWEWFDQASVGAFLNKPVELETLVRIVRECIS